VLDRVAHLRNVPIVDAIGVTKTQSRESALDERLIPGVLILKINRMNNDNEANDANEDGEELYVALPEPERQELLRQRCEVVREIQLLHQEQDRLLLEQQRQLLLLEQQRQLEEQAETRHIWQESAEDRLA